MFHAYPGEVLAVRITLPPAQNVMGPEAEMVGTGGVGVTVTTIGVEVAEVHPAAIIKVE